MNKKCFVFIVAVVFLASCQKQPISQSQPGAKQNNPSSLNPEVRQNYGQRPQPQQETWFFGLFKKKRKLNYGDQLIAEYEERMKQNVKEKRKQAKEMEKPQYSDWTYFGHKRKPKKRSPDKMKYCDECGIRH
jgi:flagellar basal body L-ring protein FlgH